MIKYLFYILFIILIKAQVFAQISPGKLAEAHKEFEGILNCKKCHDLGNQVPDSKCLDCHTEIDDLINLNRGYHVSEEVRTQKCVECHNDHHGRRFEMVRFDEDLFDHDLAGFELEGAHESIDCKACHKPDLIIDSDLKKRTSTFLGLGRTCIDCHEDVHRGTLSQDCSTCHGVDRFKGAELFTHEVSEFPLLGAHIEVACVECHPINIVDNDSFQQFKNISFSNCSDCHIDPHNAQLPGSCTSCHVEDSFEDFVGQSEFNHSLTEFDLIGSHRTVQCFDCHDNKQNLSSIFQEFKGISEKECSRCHQDVHEGKFGINCAQCHSERSFSELNAIVDFNHDLTDYPLEGKHIAVECKSCHTSRYTEEINFNYCSNCHSDYHEGEFNSVSYRSDCKDCHVVLENFEYTTFGLDEHEKTSFPLQGSHSATPCFSCHLINERWEFRNTSTSCKECHANIHEGFIKNEIVVQSECTICHSEERWATITFNHNLTNWPLEGKHQSTACKDCHMAESSNGSLLQEFFGLSSLCADCHENVHGDQFIEGDKNECNRCHFPDAWEASLFDHNETVFPLDGKHAELECSECHKLIENDKSENIILYKIESFECIDCHS